MEQEDDEMREETDKKIKNVRNTCINQGSYLTISFFSNALLPTLKINNFRWTTIREEDERIFVKKMMESFKNNVALF